MPEDGSRPVARPIFEYHGARIGIGEEGGPSPREGFVVGVEAQSHGLANSPPPYGDPFDPTRSVGRMVHLAFPLYFLRDQDAIPMLQTAFTYVNGSPTLP